MLLLARSELNSYNEAEISLNTKFNDSRAFTYGKIQIGHKIGFDLLFNFI